jgi:type IV secretory pathway TraG/TraD family ATPase VirD4
MAAITLGFGWEPATGRVGDRIIYDRDRHITCFGPNGSGKGVGLEMPNLLRLGDGGSGGEPLSIISIDSKGENRAVTGRWRKK